MRPSINFFLILSVVCASCYPRIRAHKGPKTFEPVARPVNPASIALPEGYKIEAVATGLTFPSAITFDEAGDLFVTEAGYSYGEVFLTPKLLKINKDGSKQTVVEGGKTGPWNGLAYHRGYFYVSEGGEDSGGNIVRLSPNGERKVLVGNLPSFGDHHTNGPVVGSDNYLYFSIGTATNSGVVGLDNAKFGWLKRKPDFHDIPCADIVLTGENFSTDNLLDNGQPKAVTGAFSAYGTPTTPGQVIKGKLPCSGGVMRMPLDGGDLELVAWGFRNPFGLNWHNNQLYVTDNGSDDRGSRPVWAAPDLLWKVETGKWYGWPDVVSGFSVQPKKALLARRPNEPPKPLAQLACHASAVGLDFSENDAFGFRNQAFIAQFGDQAPDVGKIHGHVGYKVVRVDPVTGAITDFAVNKGKKNAPASKYGNGGLERPIDAKFSPDARALYIVDFGVMDITQNGPAPKKETGVIWKITRQ